MSDASHELKTPLAAIRLLTDSILQTDNIDPETTREFVMDIGQEAERLSRITEDLLRLTRLDNSVLDAASVVDVLPASGLSRPNRSCSSDRLRHRRPSRPFRRRWHWT